MPSVVTPCSPGAIELAERGGYLAGGFAVDDIAQALRQAMCDDEREAVGLGRRPMRSVLLPLR